MRKHKAEEDIAVAWVEASSQSPIYLQLQQELPRTISQRQVVLRAVTEKAQAGSQLLQRFVRAEILTWPLPGWPLAGSCVASSAQVPHLSA